MWVYDLTVALLVRVAGDFDPVNQSVFVVERKAFSDLVTALSCESALGFSLIDSGIYDVETPS